MSPAPAEDPARRRLWSDARDLVACDRYDLCLPVPVFFEVLAGVDEDKREAVSDALRQRFILFPFDVVAAEFGLRRMNKRDIKLIAADADRSRHAVKVDWMIVGIAVRENVSLCTRDDRQAKHFRRIAPTGLRTGPPSDFLQSVNRSLALGGDEP